MEVYEACEYMYLVLESLTWNQNRFWFLQTNLWNFCWKTFRKNLPSLVSSPPPQLWSLIIKMCHRILIIIPDIVRGTWGNILSTNTECLYWWRFSWRNTKWEKSKEWMETVVTAARPNTFYSPCSHQYHSFCGPCCETLNKTNNIALYSVPQIDSYPL